MTDIRTPPKQVKAFHDQLLDTIMGFVASQTIYCGVQLDLFTHLRGQALTLSQLAELTRVDPRSLERLLTAAVSLGLLERRGDQYRNSPVAEMCLVKGSPHYFGDMVSYYIAYRYEPFAHTEEALRKNQPVVMAHWRDPYQEEVVARHATQAMENLSRPVGEMLAERLDLSRARRLLDIGGGSGAFARALAERHPHLEAVILDQPSVLKSTEEFIASSPAAPRLRTWPADFHRDELPSGFDLAILSNIIHGFGASACRRLMGRVHQCLNPGGQVLVIDFYLDEDKGGPVFAALFGLAAALLGIGARTYSRGEVRQWLEEAGFQDIRSQDLTPHTGLVQGTRAS